MNQIALWNPVINTIQFRLASWKAKTLSIGARLTLIKSVLSNLPIYYLSLYKAPSKVVEKIECLMKNFLWDGSSDRRKLHWVHWDVVTTSKKDGGLGIAKLTDVNAALLIKWAWRFKVQEGSLWRNIIEAIHGGRNKWMFLPVGRNINGCWKTMVAAIEKMRLNGEFLNSFFKGKIGNGNTLRFWKDNRIGTTTLMFRWPNLYASKRSKNCKVNERIARNGDAVVLSADWNAEVHLVEAIYEMEDVFFMLSSVNMSSTQDKLIWDSDGSGVFSVANVKELLRKGRNEFRSHHFNWEPWVPIKVNIHMWRTEMNRLPTCLALTRRHINLPLLTCPPL